METGCLICGAPLVYLKEAEPMECMICHKKEKSKARCVQGHYICDACHTAGLDAIISLCLAETSKCPADILEKMMSMPFCHMHGPEHHVMVGAALLTAYRNAGGKIDLKRALSEMVSRGKEIPGGSCGFWGACGAGISAGIYLSIVTGATPLADQAWGLSNQMTSSALARIGAVGGPRCCKRDAYLAISEAVRFTVEKLKIPMEWTDIRCTRSWQNHHCIRGRCPFYEENQNHG